MDTDNDVLQLQPLPEIDETGLQVYYNKNNYKSVVVIEADTWWSILEFIPEWFIKRVKERIRLNNDD